MAADVAVVIVLDPVEFARLHLEAVSEILAEIEEELALRG